MSELLPSAALGGLPSTLRDELLATFNEIIRNYREHRWEPSELNGGKFSEVVYTILRGHVDGSYPAQASKPQNMVDACRALEQASSTFPRSVRIQIPRLLLFLYEVRNNRGVGHVGGEVDPNHMDAQFVVSSAKWIMAELVRIFHTVDVATATRVVESLIEKEIATIWAVADKKRVLDTTLSMRQKTLLLLYGEDGPMSESVLASWVEHSNASVYRRDVLRRAHKEKLVEYDEASHEVHLSPLGIAG